MGYMVTSKADIIVRLQRDLLLLEASGRKVKNLTRIDLGSINEAFPNRAFPLGATHEFLCPTDEGFAASCGFISGILSSLMKGSGPALWLSVSQSIFPPSLKLFNIEPDKIIFVNLHKEKEITWAFEEALKCSPIAAVVAEFSQLDFTGSRRFQLAVEQSGVTGFILRHKLHHLTTTASATRWKISPLPGLKTDLPGVGYPVWNVELLRVRNGKPGHWQIEWSGKFTEILPVTDLPVERQKRTG